jgi:3,4-dihydroxy 2-butanone 4-phosphate synthase/GTP cyclohydrolase II
MLATVRTALDQLRAGRMIVVIDDPDRENEGDLVMAAEFATPAGMAFMVRHTTGIICAPMPADRADTLGLPLMVADNTDPHATAFTISVDAADTGTGVSARDRAATVTALASKYTRRSDLRTPGHIFPLRANDGGVLVRAGHTEATVDLLRMAGLAKVGVISEIVADNGQMMRGEELFRFAAEHGLAVLSIADLIRERRAAETTLEHTGSAELPTMHGDFRAHAYRYGAGSPEHLALIAGDLDVERMSKRGVLVRVHSECLTGDLAGSLRCDCGHQFRQSMQMMAEEGSGVLIYLRGHEGRGIGLGHKLRAYTLQEDGRDTVDANLELGLPIDSRDYSVAAHILDDLRIRRIRLITNNPDKNAEITRHGIEITDRVHLSSLTTPQNIAYLRTKRDRMGHLIEL